jgi:two-component system response regulator AtoC
VLRLSGTAREHLLSYSWPGNVRELANALERMVVLRLGDLLGVDDLPEEIREGTDGPGRTSNAPPPPSDAVQTYHDAVREAKRAILRQALDRNGNVQTQAARELSITQPYMARLMKNLNVRRK